VKHVPESDAKSRFFQRIYDLDAEYKYVLHAKDDVYLHIDNLQRSLELESTSLYFGRNLEETGYMADHWFYYPCI
jgi:hypothetical protein